MLIHRVAVAATIAALAALPACADRSREGTVPAQASRAPFVAPPGVEPVAQDVWIGVIATAEAIDLAVGAPGELIEVRVHAGDEVAAGDVIAVLDGRAAREALAIARAELSAATAAHRRAGVGVAQTKSRLETNERLADAAYLARAEVDGAAFDLDSARAARSQAGAQVAEQRARIAQLSRVVEDTAVRAPYSGTISQRYRDPGSIVAAMTPVVRLIRSGTLQVTFAVSHADAGLFAPGQLVDVLADSADSARSFGPPITATVTHIAPEVDPASSMVFVRAELRLDPAPAHVVRSGEPAMVRRR